MHKKSFTIFSISFIFFLLISKIAFPQINQNTNSKFQKALKEYNSSDYESALALFDKILENPNDRYKTISLLFKGKSLLQLKKYDESRKILIDLINDHPNKFTDEARSTLIKNYFEEGNYLQSFTEILNLIDSSNSEFYLQYGKSTGKKIALDYLSSFQIEKLYKYLKKPYLLLILSEVQINEGDYPSAKKNLQEIINNFPNSEEFSEAQTLYGEIKDKKFIPVKNLIGVILPLGGNQVPAYASSAAKEILEGIKFAVSNFNNEHAQNKIGIIIRNSKFEESTIDSIKDEFKSINSLKAVIGPIYSQEVRLTLEKFKNINIPIISPTATDDDLTLINKNFFQANPPFFVRGKIMADYIFYVENKKRIAVLNAIEGYSPLLAANFSEEFEKIGGEIFLRETYKSNTFDLKDQVDTILAFKDTLEGIYLPLADKADAPALLSQLIQDSIIVSLYGNQDWFYAKGFETSSVLSNNLIFTSDNFINYAGSDYINFNKNFYDRTKTDASRNVLYGYDTAKYLLTVMRNSGNTRAAIINKMESGIMSAGFHNNISFDENHINNYLNIVRYNNGKFELVDKFKSSN